MLIDQTISKEQILKQGRADSTHPGTFPCATTSDFFVRLPMTEFRSWRRRSTLTVSGSSEESACADADGNIVVAIVMAAERLESASRWKTDGKRVASGAKGSKMEILTPALFIFVLVQGILLNANL